MRERAMSGQSVIGVERARAARSRAPRSLLWGCVFSLIGILVSAIVLLLLTEPALDAIVQALT
jgi:hypothetical protein